MTTPPTTPPTLADLTTAIVDQGDQLPLDRLAAAVEQRNDLIDLAEAVLDHFVAEARNDGETWTDIGQVLGVTRQAAHQRATAPTGMARSVLADLGPSPDDDRARDHRGRGDHRGRRDHHGGHGHRGRHGRGRRGRGRGFFRLVDDDAKAVISAARAAVGDLGDGAIGTAHLLLGILDSPSATTTRLADAGVTADAVRAAMAARTDHDGHDHRRRPTFTRGGRSAMHLALRNATGRDADQIGPEDLLAGILADAPNGATTLLADLGVDPASLRAEATRTD